MGDTHDAVSMLEHQCLPRLIDALLSEKPPFEFPVSSACFISTERQEAEKFLGYHPNELRKHWVKDKGLLYELDSCSKEFKVRTLTYPVKVRAKWVRAQCAQHITCM